MESLHRLARAGDAASVHEALSSIKDPKSHVDETDERGFTPLYYAVSAPEPSGEVVRLLLESGADPRFVKVRTTPGFPFDLEKLPDIFSESDKDLLTGFLDRGPTESREPLLTAALKGTSVEIVRLLREYGADLGYHDEHGYTAVLDAVYGNGDRLPMVRFLIGLGLDVQAVSSYGESAITAAYRNGMFEVVSELLKAGADESLLKWSPLHKAVAIGTTADVRAELRPDLAFDSFDLQGYSPLHGGLRRGDVEIVDLLCDHGADFGQRTADDFGSLGLAVEGGSLDLVERVLESGCSSEDKESALDLAAEQGRHAIARRLLESGADPSPKGRHESLISRAFDREMILLLNAYGAHLDELDNDGRRRLLGLVDDNEGGLDGVSRETYLARRYPIEGESNPQDIGDPFRLAMIRCGWNAYWARHQFDDPVEFVCGIDGHRPPPVWCFERFGQSTTLLSDGRTVLIAGEHEDSYDPDFCIYNDVTVFDADGTITVYGYPYSVFPPTDSHSATLVGDWIYIIGSIGYMGSREGGVPVYRLSMNDFHIEPVSTTGQDPGRIFKHRAELLNGETIQISGGTVIAFKGPEEVNVPNSNAYLLNLRTLSWSQT